MLDSEQNNNQDKDELENHIKYYLNLDRREDNEIYSLADLEGDVIRAFKEWAKNSKEQASDYERLAELFEGTDIKISRVDDKLFIISRDKELLERAVEEGILAKET